MPDFYRRYELFWLNGKSLEKRSFNVDRNIEFKGANVQSVFAGNVGPIVHAGVNAKSGVVHDFAPPGPP